MDWRGNLDEDMETLTNQLIGAAIEVHRILGPGYIESVYEEALARELYLRAIPFERQKAIDIKYKGIIIGEGRLDLLIDHKLIVELKAVEKLMPVHSVQVHSYLKATKIQLGLLINFNVLLLRDGLKRIILAQ